MSSFNLKAKLILGGTFIAVIPILLISVLSYWNIKRMMTTEVRLQTERFAKPLTSSADLFLRQQLNITDSIASAYASFGGMDIDFYGSPTIDELIERRLNESLLKNLQKLGPQPPRRGWTPVPRNWNRLCVELPRPVTNKPKV